MPRSFTVEGERPPVAPITDFEGLLLLINPYEIFPFTHADKRVADAVRADVVVLDGEDEPEVVRNVTVIQAVLVRVLKQRVSAAGGAPVRTLGRPVRVPSERYEGSMVWVFEEPSPTDVELAQDWLDEHGDPFRAAA